MKIDRLKSSIAAALAAAGVWGCAGQQPMSAEEFRQRVPGAMMTKVEEFDVNRAFRDVAASWQKRAPECLNSRVRMTSQSSTSSQVIDTEYKPTVLVSRDRAELHVQQKHTRGVVKAMKEPEDGHYILVADATPLAGNRTHVKWYGPSRGYDVLYRAIRAWATGESTGCPDMTKIG